MGKSTVMFSERCVPYFDDVLRRHRRSEVEVSRRPELGRITDLSRSCSPVQESQGYQG
jgi:hypothetical protein